MENLKEARLKLCIGVLVIALLGSIAMNYMLLNHDDATQKNAVVEEAVQEEPSTPSPMVLTPYVISQSDYVIQGDQYKAQIVLAVDNTTYHQEYYVEGKRLNTNGVYEVAASSVGMKKYKGSVAYVDPVTGDSIQKSFSGNYTVSQPAVTISNTELNMMYSNYDNKFAISVPGVSNDKVKVSATGATVKQKSDLWIIVPGESSRIVTINVSAEINGKTLPIGSRDYRVKRLPIPQAYFSARDKEYFSGSMIPPSTLTHSSGTIIASYGPDGLLNVPFTVSSFATTINGITTKAEGDHLSNEQRAMINKMKAGSTLVIKDIRAHTPNGHTLILAPIVLTLN